MFNKKRNVDGKSSAVIVWEGLNSEGKIGPMPKAILRRNATEKQIWLVAALHGTLWARIFLYELVDSIFLEIWWVPAKNPVPAKYPV